ncbi:MAG TPA: hypothetical protein DEQ98_10330 [Acidobacteria bacterium]|nr:hypothetical protein [Acidobacteriota bacterium]HCE03625.1 hypothetical protein [Acidobacteriota bacterium]
MTALDDDHLRAHRRVAAAGVRVPLGELDGELDGPLSGSPASAAATLWSRIRPRPNDHGLRFIVDLGLCYSSAEEANKDQQGQAGRNAARQSCAKPFAPLELTLFSHITLLLG